MSDLDTEEYPISLPLTMLDCFVSMFSSCIFTVKYCFLIPSVHHFSRTWLALLDVFKILSGLPVSECTGDLHCAMNSL